MTLEISPLPNALLGQCGDLGSRAQGLSRKLKLCFLANANSSHTAKWVNYFCSKGHEVHLLSFDAGRDIAPEVFVHILKSQLGPSLRYFLAARQVRDIIKEIRPDLLHAHYASGYGTLGRLAEFHPYALSVWGSDVFAVPFRSPFHKRLVERNLASADQVCSTSQFMADHTRQYCDRPITVTPFGVDCERFRPLEARSCSLNEFVVGTVKNLESASGVELLIRSFAIAAGKYRSGEKLRLVIAGEGVLRKPLERLTDDLGIQSQTTFLGFVPHGKVPELLGTFSVFAMLSLRESFGVAVLEASSCGVPVIVTNIGGLSEVVQDGITGMVVPPRDPEAAAAALCTLAEDAGLRRKLGAGGREFVLREYEWSENATRMEQVYKAVLNH